MVRCDNCGTDFNEGEYVALVRGILKYKPACSQECNAKLGQELSNKEFIRRVYALDSDEPEGTFEEQ